MSIQIIPERRKQSFGEKLGMGFANLGQEVPGMMQGFGQNIMNQQRKAKQEALFQELGLPKGMSEQPESIQKELIQQFLGKKAQLQEVKNAAIRSIADMREIISRGNTGLNVLNMVTSEGRGDRAALDTAALNLERLAADMVGKGTLSQQRFKYLKDRLPSGFKTDAENEQILNEWEKILGEAGEQPLSQGNPTEKKSKVKFNPSHPEHKAKAEQLFKHFKDKEKVRKELAKEFEF